MNTSSTLKNHSPRTSGVALVIVLSIIVLMSALLVAFMSSVSTESASAKAAVRSVESRQIAESALNLAISQIRDATRGDATKRVGWASQPGVIRQFDESGNEGNVYKLYTALDMVATGAYPSTNIATVLAEAGINAAKWNETPTAFTDLNDPVLVPVSGKANEVYVRYPIADPRAAEALPGVIPTTLNTRVAGFNVKNIEHQNTLLTDAGQFAASNKKVRLLPMRARWLFQLRDGTLVPGVAKTPAVNDGIITVAGATEENPIVGRLAFWTDDETGKLNINTATENTYWDTPHASTVQEAGLVDNAGALKLDGNGNPASLNSNTSLALGAAQPTRGEFQRFPGHPATTGLSPALRWLFNNYTDKEDWKFKEEIYRLAPRVLGGQGSSVAATQTAQFLPDQRVYERDRHFTSLDEYWFRPDRTPLSIAGLYPVFSASTKDTAKTGERFTPEAFEMMRFFMTANNRSPDLNLWGLPRVTIWPIHSNDAADPKQSRRSGFDDLIAFCSSTGKLSAKKNYYFTRNNSWSQTTDISLPRNVELLSYLTKLTSKNVPGVGASFANKYSTPAPASYNSAAGVTERDQILTQIFDYIRTINLVDTGRKDGSPQPPKGTADYPLAYTPGYGSLGGANKPTLGSGQVIPSQKVTANIVSTMGFGRFPTVTEVAVVFYKDTNQAKLLAGDSDVADVPNANTSTRAVLLFEMFSPSPGYPALSEGYAYRVTEVSPFRVKTNPFNAAEPAQNLDFGSGSMNYVEVDAYRGKHGRFFMPTRGFDNQLLFDNVANNAAAAKPKVFWRTGAVSAAPANNDPPYPSYPFFSKRYIFGGAGNTAQQFEFIGGELRIEIFPLAINVAPTGAATLPPFHPAANTARPIQTINVSFTQAPAGQPPVPIRLKIPTPATNNPVDYQARLVRGAQEWITSGDTVRSMELNGVAKGDVRLAAARPIVPQEMFGPAISSADYNNPVIQRVHNLRTSWGAVYTGAKNGVHSLSATQRSDKTVDLPFAFASTGVPLGSNSSVTGDFDRGLSKHTDGAFINKPDEGNVDLDLTDNFTTGGVIPYYRGGGGYAETGPTYFSPNRLISSAVMLGSLPTGQFAMQPWQTLLFRPGHSSHKGMGKPADHYLLDLFHMPVVEPYAISEPLSTAGRVNLNTRLAPYGYVPDAGSGSAITSPAYIERTTALHGVFKGMYQFAVPNGTTEAGHTEGPWNGGNKDTILRWPINPYQTIAGGIIKKNYFKTASEICDIDLIMDNRTLNIAGTDSDSAKESKRSTFWESHNMTGDNMRERPYSHIYPRLTTKSNTFTVHIRAQSVSKRARKNWDTFDETDDLITGEYRGSSTIERFIDPNDDDIANFDAVTEIDKAGSSLEPYYRFRVINTKQFTAR